MASAVLSDEILLASLAAQDDTFADRPEEPMDRYTLGREIVTRSRRRRLG